MIIEIVTNKILIIPLFAWALAQILKTLIALVQGKGLDFRYLFSSGGMPSSHSVIVTALATTAGMVEGFDSAVFGISAILA